MKKRRITLVKNSAGNYINLFKESSDPDAERFGYIQMFTAGFKLTDDGATTDDNRTYNQRGTVNTLKLIVEDYIDQGYLEGRLVREEYVESEIPDNHYKRMLRSVEGSMEKQVTEEAMENFVKRAGKDGPVLTKGGERIFMFPSWDIEGTKPDRLVKHDNDEEVLEWRQGVWLEKQSKIDAGTSADLEKK